MWLSEALAQVLNPTSEGHRSATVSPFALQKCVDKVHSRGAKGDTFWLLFGRYRLSIRISYGLDFILS